MENQQLENGRINESVTGVDEVWADVSVARKLLDEPLAVQPVDLPDFVRNPLTVD